MKRKENYILKLCFGVLVIGLFFISIDGYSQAKYNLPPNQILNPKAKTNFDYSYKLSQIPSYVPENVKNENFLYEISDDVMKDFQKNHLSTYEYYQKADSFYKNLSPKVKYVFTVDELWDIYIFDDKLTQKLKDIK